MKGFLQNNPSKVDNTCEVSAHYRHGQKPEARSQKPEAKGAVLLHSLVPVALLAGSALCLFLGRGALGAVMSGAAIRVVSLDGPIAAKAQGKHVRHFKIVNPTMKAVALEAEPTCSCVQSSISHHTIQPFSELNVDVNVSPGRPFPGESQSLMLSTGLADPRYLSLNVSRQPKEKNENN